MDGLKNCKRGTTSMRHRGDAPQPRKAFTSEYGSTLGTLDQGSLARPVVPTQRRAVGKDKAPPAPLIPKRKMPTPETSETSERKQCSAVPEVTIPVPWAPVPAAEATGTPETDEPTLAAPHTARWRARHRPRVLAGVLLLLALGGTSVLGLDYQQNPGRDQLISLAVGLAVVVGLRAVLIASTPQVVSLRGSVLTIHNRSGSERFDLDDGQQPVDLLGEPGSSQWALVLHRADRTALVLRRRDVDAAQLDPIVRHYRRIAHRTYAERQARFER